MKKVITRNHLLWTIISFSWTETLQHSADQKVKWLAKKQNGWKQNLFSLSEATTYRMVKWKPSFKMQGTQMCLRWKIWLGKEKVSWSNWHDQKDLETADSAGPYCCPTQSTWRDYIYVGRNLEKSWKDSELV